MNGAKSAWLAVAVLSLSATTALAARGKSATKNELSGVLNLNTATAQQLDALPGIGQKAAKRILDFRSKTPFAKVDDLRKVKGFGAKKMEKLKPYLTVTGPTTLLVRRVKDDAKAGLEAASKPAAPTTPVGRRGPSK
jgi:competence protein ComEA